MTGASFGCWALPLPEYELPARQEELRWEANMDMMLPLPSRTLQGGKTELIPLSSMIESDYESARKDGETEKCLSRNSIYHQKWQRARKVFSPIEF